MSAIDLPMRGESGALAVRSHLWFYLVFFLGGMPALIYQVAWQRVLTLFFGVDIYSTSVTVATFMLGLGVGSLFGGWLADRVQRPALYYAGVEVLMAGCGAASLPLFAAIGQWFAGGSLANVIVVDFLLLLLPTTLMGMTLPLMCRVIISRDNTIGRQFSVLYGVNTLGAALGAVLSAYLLIGLVGLNGAVLLAALLNVSLAAAVGVIVTATAATPGSQPIRALPPQLELGDQDVVRDGLRHRAVLAFSFLSGFIALGYEIVWYRLLGILLHSTVYVFGTILCACLAGIALGAVLARKRIDEGRCIERFAMCQLGIALYTFVLFTALGYFSNLPPLRDLIGASFFTTFHPAPELVAGHVDRFSLYSLLDIGFWSALLVAVPTVLMGFGFTNLMREAARHVEKIGQTVGGLYFMNIVGSTLGSLAVGFVVIHYFGSENALKMLIVAGSAVPILLFITGRRHAASEKPLTLVRATRPLMYASCILTLAALLVFPSKGKIIQAIHFADHDGVEFVSAEDRSGVSVLRRQNHVIAFSQEQAVLGQQRLYIDGSHHGDGSELVSLDQGVELALAAHPAPRRVLSIGLGDGQMAATAVLHPDVEELVVIELNGTLDRMLRHTRQGRTVLESPKLTYVVDDGRRWLLANPQEEFDLIMMFPLHAAHAYSGNLYSREFFGILAAHLQSGGILFFRTVDLYSTAKTVADVFPHVLRFDNSAYMASANPFELREERLSSASETLVRLKADREIILEHTRDAPINRDLTPNSEYYLTYPYASSLQTRVRPPASYAAADTDRFHRLLVPATVATGPKPRHDRHAAPDTSDR
jgi:spermidine synthase/MFS family permease